VPIKRSAYIAASQENSQKIAAPVRGYLLKQLVQMLKGNPCHCHVGHRCDRIWRRIKKGSWKANEVPRQDDIDNMPSTAVQRTVPNRNAINQSVAKTATLAGPWAL
jgi:hypothetical protein